MSLKAYKLMDSIIQSADLLYSGQQLIEFANAVYKEKNRTTIVKHFYERLYQWAFTKYTFDDFTGKVKRNVFICNGLDAARMYIALFIPAETSTVKSINNIRILGENIISNFIDPVGKCISEKSLEKIINHLEKEYRLFSNVFKNKKNSFVRINKSHKIYNNECLTLGEGEEIVNHFFLYHMREKNIISPEEVLFHEFGHALHVKRFGDINKVPDDIIDKLQSLCFPSLKQIDADEQRELFADVIGFGLMYQTPFEKFEKYKNIRPDHKKFFKLLAEEIIEGL